ncbi:hypothetical protein A0H81_05073 [Grifola frondosa]|uniref:F-box domain-containing protein n=1 Tax=Grifola frondosa TaxID=5627 RepID=A0A1C7ME19_GRIFR|nr:hypothetical protein A0H81_05073 [Grifola frondosa]
MPVTRRQSGKLPVPSRFVRSGEAMERGTDDELLSDLTDIEVSDGDESEDDDYVRAPQTPARKRAKVTSRTKASKKDKAPLSALPTMPIDILFEIFGHLTPRDLISITATNKAFRQLLMTRKAITVWKAVRKQEYDAPDCPPGISEPQWANLLWGGNTCQECGTKNVVRINWGILRRVCTACMKQHLVRTAAFKKNFPDLDVSIMELLPYSNVGGWAHGWATKTRFYWDADIVDMADKLADLERDIHMRKPHARRARKEFKAAKVAQVDGIRKHIVVCEKWMEQVTERRRQDQEILKEERLEAIRSRLVELGHDYRDAKDAVPLYDPRIVAKPLTDRSWKQMRIRFERDATAAKERRFAYELEKIKSARKDIVANIYAEHCKDLTPLQKSYMPFKDDVCQFAGFAELIDADREVAVTEADFADAVKALPDLIAKFSENRKSKLAALVPPRPAPEQAAVGSSKLETSTPAPADLATSVFACTPCYTWRPYPYLQTPACSISHSILSGEQAVLHVTHEPQGPAWDAYLGNVKSLSFSADGSAAAASLVKLLGLDADIAVPRDLDDIDARFACMACGPHVHQGASVRSTMTWRQCIWHFVLHKANTQHSAPDWYRLTDEEAALAREDERPDPAALWTCNRCALNRKRDELVMHVKTFHAVDDPVDGEDLFRNPRENPSQPRNGFLYIDGRPAE